MPFNTTWIRNGIERKAFGKVTGGDIITFRNALYGDERFDKLRYILTDFTEVDSIDMTEEDIRKLAYLDKAAALTNPKCKIVIVIRDDTKKILAEKYANLMNNSPWQSMVFETVEQAREWLDMDVAAIRR